MTKSAPRVGLIPITAYQLRRRPLLSSMSPRIRAQADGVWLNDTVVFVTGAGSGIGLASSRLLAQRGAHLAMADIDRESVERAAGSISPAPLAIELDVTDAAACEAAVQRVLERHGRIDMVWANAGIGTIGPLHRMDAAAWTRTIEVNLLGAYHTVRAALPAVIERRGYVAVTASLASFGPCPYMSAYAAAKAGVEAMCNALRIEVAHRGVGVATIHPSWIDSRMVQEGQESRAFTRLRAELPPPLNRTYPVEHAAVDIVAGFEQRRRRICTPRFVRLFHLLRPAMTSRVAERGMRAIGPELAQLHEQDVAERGAAAASISERFAQQLRPAPLTEDRG
jgi:NAD(P)-dependent dehydrogenase (short-subunit alcohol dehydrogenase family)